ncbi:hypothetical protein PHLGIDRAFT_424311 [Phlebiopsis gigantea 11061_1 CR5-6]|uniref:Transmembrane protein n=1 Tax=Phlebiopsis gigantea (strain 11061_1 CR5-6) TaxID=745531 RepID=A0A0C3PLK5_PHLG1|nr:hypothetical protein PHLGIDRAFT_424311 [Phlebiopsis gigantea 11061_1 CR5-6]
MAGTVRYFTRGRCEAAREPYSVRAHRWSHFWTPLFFSHFSALLSTPLFVFFFYPHFSGRCSSYSLQPPGWAPTAFASRDHATCTHSWPSSFKFEVQRRVLRATCLSDRIPRCPS